MALEKLRGSLKGMIIINIIIFVDTPLCLIKVLTISRRNVLVIKNTSKSDQRTFKNRWKAILIAPVYAQFSFEKNKRRTTLGVRRGHRDLSY